MADPTPGWIPPKLGVSGECMRQALSCVAGLHPIKLDYIAHTSAGNYFWQSWFEQAARFGLHLEWASEWGLADDGTLWIEKLLRPYPFADDEFWVGGVGCTGRTDGKYGHAVAMRGQELYYDNQDELPPYCGNPDIGLRVRPA